MIFSQDRTEMRRVYVDAWRKHCDGAPLSPLEARIVDVLVVHPEYHALLEDDAALAREWTPEDGAENPFLHLAMHLTLAEQRATDRPAGVAAALARLEQRRGDRHRAEHDAMEALGAALWAAARAGRPPDESAYLADLRQRAATRR